MPRNMIFQVGDIINDTHFGYGIIIGQKPLSDSKHYNLQYYHVYTFGAKYFMYRVNSSLKLHHPANDKRNQSTCQ